MAICVGIIITKWRIYSIFFLRVSTPAAVSTECGSGAVALDGPSVSNNPNENGRGRCRVSNCEWSLIYAKNAVGSSVWYTSSRWRRLVVTVIAAGWRCRPPGIVEDSPVYSSISRFAEEWPLQPPASTVAVSQFCLWLDIPLQSRCSSFEPCGSSQIWTIELSISYL